MQGSVLSKNTKESDYKKSKYKKMGRPVTWWYFLYQSIAIIIAIAGFYYMAVSKIEDQASAKALLKQEVVDLRETVIEIKADFKEFKKESKEDNANFMKYLDKKFDDLRDDNKERDRKIDAIYKNTK